MIDGVTFLTVLSLAMFLGSYISGYIPLMFSMSESRLRILSIFGAGLLIGTALSVIIPEGVEALYNADQNLAIHNSGEVHSNHNDIHGAGVQMEDPIDQGDSKVKREASDFDTASIPGLRSSRQKRVAEDDHEHDLRHNSHEHGGHGIHQRIGFSLVVGFVFMLLVDQVSASAAPRGERAGRSRLGISATIGLVVHAAADGIALGSASVIDKSDVQLIVFVAIMLHKAPAAFGLVSFLMVEGIDGRSIKKHLLVFSCAAPVSALVTFVVMKNSGQSLSTAESNTGVLMLFSAGTFLYVATVHVLPELASHSKATQDYSLVVDVQSPASAGHSHSAGTSFSVRELLAIISGAMVPAVLSSGHSH